VRAQESTVQESTDEPALNGTPLRPPQAVVVSVRIRSPSEWCVQPDDPLAADVSPDHEERIRDFLARHGGAGNEPPRSAELDPGVRGFSEVAAADGYRLRCDWTRSGSHEDMRFSEIPPP
jgi:hypothetical protein